MISLESLEIWLRAAAMMAGRLNDGSMSAETQLEVRETIDRALVIVVEARQ